MPDELSMAVNGINVVLIIADRYNLVIHAGQARHLLVDMHDRATLAHAQDRPQ